METAKLKTIPDRASLPLLVTGLFLTFAGIIPLIALTGMFLSGSRPETIQSAGTIPSAFLCLLTGVPGVFTFVLRKKRYAPVLGRVAGGLLLVYAAIFPVTLIARAPFFIPLIFYGLGATGIWALLKSKP